MKQLKLIEAGKKAKGIFSYMNKMAESLLLKCKATTVEEFLNVANLSDCLEIRSLYYISQVQAGIKASGVEQKVWMNELIATDIDRMSRAHLIYLMYRDSISVLSHHKFKDERISKVLTMVCQLFAVKHLKENLTALYETGFLQPGNVTLMEKAFKHLLVELRPHMLGLVEWFTVGDTYPTVIGNKYGDIYEA